MGTALALLVLVIGGAICLANWRAGIFVAVLAGFLQDPIRKLVPDEPVMFSLMGVFLFGICFVSALLAGEDLGFKEFNRFHRALLLPGTLFLGWVAFAVGMTFLKTGSLVLSGIGAMAYLAPLPALMLGYRFARVPGDVTRLMIFYATVATIYSASLYLEISGVDWVVLGSVGDGFVVYPESGGVATLMSGLYRSPEVAGWHAAAAICLLLVVGFSRRPGLIFTVLVTLAVMVIVPSLFLTGRRKFLVEVAIFLSLSGALITYFRAGGGKLFWGFAVAVLVSVAAFLVMATQSVPQGWEVYLERGLTTAGDSTDRFSQMTFGMLRWVVAQNGFFGAGAGAGSQGAQHFGGGTGMVGAAAEGGLGKVLAELGIPGVVLLFWLGIGGIRYLAAVLDTLGDDEESTAFLCGVVAFLGANALVFATAHQIFGDPSVLTFLGLLVGVVCRYPYFSRRVEAVVVAPPVKRMIGRRFADRAV